jgi:hypothetical protein
MSDLSSPCGPIKNSGGHPKAAIPLDAVLILGGFILVCLVELLGILVLNDFKLVYTMDDPYIHLAVAEEIARGHYGVNGAEFCAPCSSPIWPFLIAPLARTPLVEVMPLLLNLGFGFLTCVVVLRGLRRAFPSAEEESGLALQMGRAAMGWAVLLGCNVVGLVFSGMEHNLQVLMAVMVVDGMIQFSKTGNLDRWFIMAAIGGPWVRYENLALTAVACGLLFLKKQKMSAIVIGGVAVAGLAAFSGFLHSLGLPLIPSSITSKSHLLTDPHLVGGILQAVEQSLMGARGIVLLLMTAVLAGLGLRWGSRETRCAALCLAAAGILHVCFGAYGWYHRYECYIYAASLFGIFLLMGDSPICLPRKWTHTDSVMVACFGLLISYPSTAGLLTIPVASNNIYDQQFQMHRFVTEWWKKPLAVNDLGWVSFQNDAYILDLWGLASQEALEARMKRSDPSWMVEVARKRGVELAIVYENWVPARAIGWIKVGEMHLSRDRVTPANSEVTFFATSLASVEEIDRKLKDFKKTLPPGVVLLTRSDRQSGP